MAVMERSISRMQFVTGSHMGANSYESLLFSHAVLLGAWSFHSIGAVL